jgi:ribosomal protein S18 acetylase RimI-like enzyme
MNIRQATPADSLLLSGLCRDVQSLHAEHHPDIFKIPQSDDFAVAFFDEILVDPMARIFILEKNGQALGYVLCKLMERPEGPFTFTLRYLQIDQISVRPEARGQGVGAALMKQAERFANELDVQRIQLDSWDFNIRAHAFFERLGFKKFHFRFWQIL